MAIRCEYCGKEYEEDPGKFCDQCGRVLSRFNIETSPEDNAVDYKKCMKCGHRNDVEATVCLNCGDRLYDRQSI